MPFPQRSSPPYKPRHRRSFAPGLLACALACGGLLAHAQPRHGALRSQPLAEGVLLDLRCADDDGARFAAAAGQWSNCPSGQEGGDLGWLSAEDCAPEFAREVFGTQEVGVLSRLVHSRFGLHVVEVCERQPGQALPFEQVHTSVALLLRQQAWVNALRQYLQLLAGAAEVEGVQLDAADTPLVQ